MSWRLKQWSDFKNIEADWARIAKSTYNDHPFLDTNFVVSALEYFADSNVYLVVEQISGTVRSIGIVRKKRWGVWETFSPSQLPYMMFISSDPQSIAVITRSLIDALPGVVLLLGLNHFDDLYMDGYTAHDNLEQIEYGQTMNVHCSGRFEDYWNARPRKLRSNIRRYERRLHDRGVNCRMDVRTQVSEVDESINTYGDIESAGWKGEHGSAIHANNLQGKFYCSLLKKFAHDDGVRMFHLYANDEVVASRLAILKNGMMIFLKTTYDERYREYAPGRLLLKYVLNYAFEERTICNIEFYTKATRDLLQWASSDRAIFHQNVYLSRTIKRLVQIARRQKLTHG